MRRGIARRLGDGPIEYALAGATPAVAGSALMDADGAALVLHAAADDDRTDPAGNVGDRLACRVVSS